MLLSKGNVSPGWLFFLVLQSITFSMSSLLLGWYSNAVSVCLVLVVNLPRRHLMFLVLLPNHPAYESKVNVHSLFLTDYCVFIEGYHVLFFWSFVVFLAEQMTHFMRLWHASSHGKTQYMFGSQKWNFKCSLSTAIVASLFDSHSVEVSKCSRIICARPSVQNTAWEK